MPDVMKNYQNRTSENEQCLAKGHFLFVTKIARNTNYLSSASRHLSKDYKKDIFGISVGGFEPSPEISYKFMLGSGSSTSSPPTKTSPCICHLL